MIAVELTIDQSATQPRGIGQLSLFNMHDGDGSAVAPAKVRYEQAEPSRSIITRTPRDTLPEDQRTRREDLRTVNAYVGAAAARATAGRGHGAAASGARFEAH
jgi:hypothetical protein